MQTGTKPAAVGNEWMSYPFGRQQPGRPGNIRTTVVNRLGAVPPKEWGTGTTYSQTPTHCCLQALSSRV